MACLLTIESSCDETAAAVITDTLEVRAAVVASQEEFHQAFSGVVPEIAARAHVERMLPVIHQALEQAQISLAELDAIAVAYTPGLAGSLMVGMCAAKTLALVLAKPLIAINHLHAHVYACRLSSGRDVFPCLGLIVSGGHSNFYACRTATDFRYLGGTIDDAAGEAFDKVAAMLGLPFPGGPALANLAAAGDPRAYAFPRPFLADRERLELSFSGLKTAVRYQIAGKGRPDFSKLNLPRQVMADVAASFQEAVVDCLVGKTQLALERTGLKTLCIGGGVAANVRFRERIEALARSLDVTLYLAPVELCTDNAVMGAIAWEHFRSGEFASLDLDIVPGLMRGDSLPRA